MQQRQLVLSFRGTSDILDVLTDVQLLQTPLEFREVLLSPYILYVTFVSSLTLYYSRRAH